MAVDDNVRVQSDAVCECSAGSDDAVRADAHAITDERLGCHHRGRVDASARPVTAGEGSARAIHLPEQVWESRGDAALMNGCSGVCQSGNNWGGMNGNN